MQVLVALFRADGGVVTRDELVHLCWDGRIVGDDAINRVISKIRHLAEQCDKEFRVETIPRVGYRLVCRDSGKSAFKQTLPKLRSGGSAEAPTRRAVLAGAGLAACATAIGIGFWFSAPRVHQPSRLARLYYQRGIIARGQNDLSHGEQALSYFRQATRADPQYAQAWGGLAWSYRALLEYGPRPDADRLAQFARSAAHRALELDPDDPDAKAALLMLKPFYRNWSEIEKGCRDLLSSHPGHNIARFNLGLAMAQTGRWRDSIPHFQEVAIREPFWPLGRMQMFRALRASGRLEEAEEQLDAAGQLWPRRIDIWSSRIRHLLMSGREAEALAFIDDQNARPIDSGQAVQWSRSVARAYASGSPEHKRRAIEELLSLVRVAPGAVVPAALDCSLLGDLDNAFRLLSGYYFGRGEWSATRSRRPATDVLFNAMSAPLRRESRFQLLVEEIGLERHWRETRTRPDYRRFA